MSATTRQAQKQRLNKVMKLAGPRYETGVNVEVPIRSAFYALIKSRQFVDDINAKLYKFAEAGQYIGAEPFYSVDKARYDTLKSLKSYIVGRLKEVSISPPDKSIRVTSITSKINDLHDQVDELIKLVEAADAGNKIIIPKESHQSVKSELNNLYELMHEAYSIKALLEGHDFSVFVKKAFILKGEAGIGKTHLLCDFANEAYSLGHQVYIFLGEEFIHTTDPIQRMGSLLEDNDFLQKIDGAAKKSEKRAVILIDAVNEAQIKVDWDKLLKINKYKHMTFVISIRTGYENVVLSSRLQRGVDTLQHLGLNTGNINNIEAFFSYFKVPMPDVPLISHEFNNPLFVKIFCRTYKRKTTVRGDVGSTTLFENYIKQQSRQVRKSAKLPSDTHLWNKIVKPIAEWMGQNATNRILSKKAHELIESALPGKSATVLQELERHWLLTRVPHYTKSGKIQGYEYRFPYQRFSDHLIVRYLLKHHLKKTGDPRDYFKGDTPLGKILLPNYPYNLRSGLIEAMSIQIPERLKGLELIEVAPKKFKNTSIAETSFLNSLLWRDLEMDGDSWKYLKKATVIKLINHYAQGNATLDGFDSVLLTVLSTSCIEGHPLDASIFHAFLSRRKMAARDSFWIPFLYYQYGDDGSVIDRYITWASSSLARKIKSKTTIRQTAIVLSWFLASSHRELRDKTTKALVNLLDGRYQIIKELLELFDSVDDIYILERLYAVAYGCALREPRPSKLKALAQYVYKSEFINNSPKVNILLRDYARGVVEVYHLADPSIGFDEKLYKPPYSSIFPKRIISEKTLQHKYPYTEKENESYDSIGFSTRASVGDFGRYIIESNLRNFSNTRIDGTPSTSESDRCLQILNSLTNTQKQLVETIRVNPLTAIVSINFVSRPTKQAAWPDNKTTRDNWRQLKASLNLSASDLRVLRKYLRGEHLQDNSSFDPQRGSRWIFDRAVRLGWNPATHGTFDRNISRNNFNRHAHKIERIGKKYQWQALYEFMARVADNYKMIEREGAIYNGPWQLHLRNIDPSHTMNESRQNLSHQVWWQKISYDDWRLHMNEKEWLQIDDIPDMRSLMLTHDPKGKSWLNLNTYFERKQQLPHIPEEKQYGYRRRELWLMLKSYLIHNKDLDAFIKWSSDKNYEGRWMPESHEFYNVFYREFPHHAAFMDQYSEYYGRIDWHGKTTEIPFELMITDDEFAEEGSGYDHSIKDSFSIRLPAKQIYANMNIRSSAIEGQYKNSHNEIVFLDPHVKHTGAEALLASSTHFAEYLKLNNYALVWTVLGEKQILGGRLGRDENWPGRYEFSGTYYLDTTTMEVLGDLHTKVHRTKDS